MSKKNFFDIGKALKSNNEKFEIIDYNSDEDIFEIIRLHQLELVKFMGIDLGRKD